MYLIFQQQQKSANANKEYDTTYELIKNECILIILIEKYFWTDLLFKHWVESVEVKWNMNTYTCKWRDCVEELIFLQLMQVYYFFSFTVCR